ncbi:MAG: SDR family oxidoreductase [Flavobacteriales bacterium]|nr:SDR family oxidoreductase [Flavobacteriales bacterium]
MEERKLVIVTGASRGIGRETAISLVREHGAHVLAVSRDAAALKSLVDEQPNGEIEHLTLDLSLDHAPAELLQAVGGRRVHGLVHNAGAMLNRPMGTYTSQQLTALYCVNVFAPLLISQALLKNLEGDPPGHVVHISSMGGFQDSAKFPGLAAYSASKAALACMSQCLAEEFKERSIRSNCLSIGAVATEMLEEAFPGYRAPTTAKDMGSFIARFVLEGHNLFNGKVLPVASTTP